MKSITVAITGASGAISADRLLWHLNQSPQVQRINLVISDAGRAVLAQELVRLGVIIMPVMPAFYHRPQTLEPMADHFVYRVLDHLGIEHRLETVWSAEKLAE